MIYTMGQLLIQIGLPTRHLGWIYVNYMNRSIISECRLANCLSCAFPSASMASQIQKKMERRIISVVIRALPVLTSFASLSKKHPEAILVLGKCSIINSKFWCFKEPWLWSKKVWLFSARSSVVLVVFSYWSNPTHFECQMKTTVKFRIFILKKMIGVQACLTPFA